MINREACRWLMDYGGETIRYRIAHEFLVHDEYDMDVLKRELLQNTQVKKWLGELEPEAPPVHPPAYHGSFDDCMENALLKALHLGLHAGIPELDAAVENYLVRLEACNGMHERKRDRTLFKSILAANLLYCAGYRMDFITRYMLGSLEEIHQFVSHHEYDLYVHEEERNHCKGLPSCWAGRPIMKPEIVDGYGFVFPLLYDIIGLSCLYELDDAVICPKVDDVIDYIACDAFHDHIADGYGILVSGNRRYHAMGWDPKFPGWHDITRYMEESSGMPKLLFFALYISKYKTITRTKWFLELLSCLERYKTPRDTYCFPAQWLREKQGYAVMGSHLSFGENRGNKNWREIESTFYMQLLRKYL